MENQPTQQTAEHAGPSVESAEGSFGANPLQTSAFDGAAGGMSMRPPAQRVELESQGGQCVDMQGTVNTDALRVRSKPGTEFPEISDPIVRGTSVHITARENGWYEISPNRWVFAQYVDTGVTQGFPGLGPELNMSVPAEGGVDTNLVIVTDPAELAAIQGSQVADFSGELNMEGLTGDVGKNSANDSVDVATIQTLLNNAGAGIRVTGVADRVLEGAIYMYQKGRGTSRDAVVSKDGGTWRALLAGEWQFSEIDDFTLDTEDLGPESIPAQDDVEAEYGDVDNIPLTRVSLPFPLYYAGSPVSSVSVHEDVAASLSSALNGVLAHYGLEEIERLRINHNYGGSYNKRKMRGGSSWSMHAYGIAIDLNAAENGLNTTASAALFAKPEYEPFLDIMERNGWYSLGRAKNYDYMHFQTAYPV